MPSPTKARAKSRKKPDAAVAAAEPEITSIKGFGRDWTCLGFQFEIGKTYEIDGEIKACERGFHAIEGHPLEVFGYYAPGVSRYAITKQGGALSRHSGDSKVASARITIEAEIGIPEIVKRAIDWVFARAKPEGDVATGYQGAASATGYHGAASATGDRGAAMACGWNGRAMGGDGCALFLVYRDDDGVILHAWAGIVGRDGIKPGVFYRLDASGKPVEAA